MSINSQNYLIITRVSGAAKDAVIVDNRPAVLIVEHINTNGEKNWRRFEG